MFVDYDSRKTLDGRFENVCAWRAAEWNRDLVAFNAKGDFVLRARERETYAFVTCKQRASRKFFQDRGKVGGRQRAVAVVLLGQVFACWDEGDGTGALAADLAQPARRAPGDRLPAVIARLCAYVPGTRTASIALVGPKDVPATVAAGDELARAQDRRQVEAGEGPLLAALAGARVATNWLPSMATRKCSLASAPPSTQ